MTSFTEIRYSAESPYIYDVSDFRLDTIHRDSYVAVQAAQERRAGHTIKESAGRLDAYDAAGRQTLTLTWHDA